MADKNAEQFDAALVRRIARLARIGVDEQELDALAAELSDILGFVEQLSAVDTQGVTPYTGGVEAMKMREDEVRAGGDAAPILANAPMRDEDYFVVPKVVE